MPKKISSFQSFNDKDSQNYLAEHFPKGKLTAKRYDSNSIMYSFIMSIATFVKVFVGDLLILARNRDIQQAEELLPEWETSVKIPSEVPRRNSIEGRRNAVECLISKIPVFNFVNGSVDERTTFEHYVKCLTGLEITVRSSRVTGSGSQFPLKFAFKFGSSLPSASFIFIIGVTVEGTGKNNFFKIPFPIQFFDPKIPDTTINLLNNILDRVIPSFCRWEFEAIIS